MRDDRSERRRRLVVPDGVERIVLDGRKQAAGALGRGAETGRAVRSK